MRFYTQNRGEKVHFNIFLIEGFVYEEIYLFIYYI